MINIIFILAVCVIVLFILLIKELAKELIELKEERSYLCNYNIRLQRKIIELEKVIEKQEKPWLLDETDDDEID